MFKKIFGFLAVFIMMSCLMTVTVSADEKMTTAVFGDSIPAGYGLDGYDPSDTSAAADCFANLWAKQNGLEYGKSFQNFSKMGLPSRKINNVIKSADKSFLKNAKVVIISAGGNDVIDTYGEVMFDVMKDEQELLEKYDIRPDMSDLDSIQKEILSTVMNPLKYKVLERMAEKCTDEKYISIYDNIPKKFEKNIRESVGYIHDISPDAEIILLMPYDPLKTLTVENKLINSVDNTISEINRLGKEMEKDKSFDGKLHCISLLSEFEGKYLQLANVLKMDIHPSAEGHKYILGLIERSLSRETDVSKEEKTSVSGTAASVSEQKNSPEKASDESLQSDISQGQRVYLHPAFTVILFCAAVLCVVLIAASFAAKHSKKNKKNGFNKKTRK